MNSILTKEEIRNIFLANGFNIKPGNDDLKDYVYGAAQALQEAILLKVSESESSEGVSDGTFKIVLTHTEKGVDWDTQFLNVIDQEVYQMLVKESKVLEDLYRNKILDGKTKHAIDVHLWSFISAYGLNCVAIEWK